MVYLVFPKASGLTGLESESSLSTTGTVQRTVVLISPHCSGNILQPWYGTTSVGKKVSLVSLAKLLISVSGGSLYCGPLPTRNQTETSTLFHMDSEGTNISKIAGSLPTLKFVVSNVGQVNSLGNTMYIGIDKLLQTSPSAI